MRIRSCSIRGYRNLADTQLSFEGDFFVFVGDNAQGKTNLLEALYLLVALKSFRGSRTSELIRRGTEGSGLEARMESRGVVRHYQVRLDKRGKKFAVDGRSGRLASYLSAIKAVCFSPDDLAMIRGGPSGRREFIDRATFDIDSRHLDRVRRFNRSLSARGALLKRRPSPSSAELDAFEPGLVQAGAAVLVARLRTAALLEPLFQQLYAVISEGRRGEARLAYQCSFGETGAIEQALAEGREQEAWQRGCQLFSAALARVRRGELMRRTTLAGPQRDDLKLSVGDEALRQFGSQGQVRSAALALKMAERLLVRQASQQMPVFMIDDVGSELDRGRAERLMRHLKEQPGQVFLTTTSLDHVPLERHQYTAWRVRGGELELLPTAPAPPVSDAV